MLVLLVVSATLAALLFTRITLLTRTPRSAQNHSDAGHQHIQRGDRRNQPAGFAGFSETIGCLQRTPDFAQQVLKKYGFTPPATPPAAAAPARAPRRRAEEAIVRSTPP